MMNRKVALSIAMGTAFALGVSASQAESYGPYPVTLQGYSGEKEQFGGLHGPNSQTRAS